MSAAAQGVAEIWPVGVPVVGVIHLDPLPGAPRWGGSLDAVVDGAAADAAALMDAGFDGVIVENFSDAPFFSEQVGPETVAGMARAVLAVRSAAHLPVGVNVLRNDARAALAIASVTDAAFIRVNVHTGSMWTDQGLVHGRAANTMRLRATLAPSVAVLADVHVKHATPPAGSTLQESARDAWHRGLADALVVSGPATGMAPDAQRIRRVKESVPEAAVWVGSGLTAQNAAELLDAADGAIVGSAVMEGGRAGNRVDPARARALIDAAR